MIKSILVVSSTFPSSDTDPVPAFVKDQIIALKALRPELKFAVLAPHEQRSCTKNENQHRYYTEHRFHYFWPFTLERLAGRGIMPTLDRNKLYYLMIPFLFIGEFIALYRLTKSLKPDIIYAHWFTPQAVVAYAVSRLTGIPYVFTTHASDVKVWKNIPAIGAYIVKHTTTNANAFTAVSSQTMSKLAAFFTPQEWQQIKSRGEIIPMGVNVNLYNQPSNPIQLKRRYHLGNKKVILFIGRLAEKKGVAYLIEAFSRISQSNSHLVIAGDGPLLESLQDEAHKLRIDDTITFTGFISGQTKIDYLTLADIVVVPSIVTLSGDTEGLPVTILEAMAAGKICIATNSSGAAELITNHQQGFIIPEKDVTQMSKAIQTAINLSPSRAKAMRIAAMQAAESFDWQNIALLHLNKLL